MCLEGIRAKFFQNHNLFLLLKETSPKLLVEASTDRIWGTGIALHDDQVLNQENGQALDGCQPYWWILETIAKNKLSGTPTCGTATR